MMNLIDRDVRAVILAHDNTKRLWELARDGFLKHERGVVTIYDDVSDFRGWCYLPQARLRELGEDFSAAILPTVEAYDPLREFVIVYAQKQDVRWGTVSFNPTSHLDDVA